MNKHGLKVFFQFYMEWTFACLILLFFHLLSSMHMPLLSGMVISGAGALIFIILLEKKGNQAKPLFFLLILPAIYLAGALAGIKVLFISFIALFVFWRIPKHDQDATGGSESVWLVLTFLVGLLMSPLASHYGGSFLKQLAFLLIFQLLFIIAGQFFLKWIDIDQLTKKRFAYDFLILLGIGLAFTIVISLGRNMLKEVFFFILTSIGKIFSLILYPVLALTELQFIKDRSSRLLSPSKIAEEEYEPPFVSKQVVDPDLWGPIVFAVIGGLLFYYLYKKNKIFNKDSAEDASTAPGYIVSSTLQDSIAGSLLLKRNSVVPENKIRKEIYQLEKFAQKKGLPRLNHEAINEWLNRLGIVYQDRTVRTYQQVRYGGLDVTEAEEWFIDEVKSIKKQLSAIQKDDNKTSVKNHLRNFFKR